ncbi:hypothetical protein GCM10019016_089860 [Streptomyces prasinosporus]|uniref:Type II toxin-antitoxin system RelE/ParE family toxin n=1 Tax=Streptomyces prasinosporus TaxID=68256 RepID=A0ABP6U4Q3_9ACTN
MTENTVTVREARAHLAGPSGPYRLWVGSHRVAHQIDDGELVVLVVLVVKAGDRRDAYRDL